jgi:hypothetical protein
MFSWRLRRVTEIHRANRVKGELDTELRGVTHRPFLAVECDISTRLPHAEIRAAIPLIRNNLHRRRLSQRRYRALRIEALESRVVLSAETWNLAADFSASFVAGVPQENPNGPWSYLGRDGTTDSLVVTNGSSPNTFGVGAGWADSGGVPSYARGGVFGFPNATAAMAGHGPNRILWTAPASVDLGGVEITGLFTQATFESTRQMQIRIYKNDFADPLLTLDADFAMPNMVLSLPATLVAMEAGDTLTIMVDGSGPRGNGVATFAAWNVVITEYQLSGDYNTDGTVDAADYSVWRDHFDSTGIPGTVLGDGTTTGSLGGQPDGVVDQWDYQFWKQHYGNSLNPGGAPHVYHPSAIIVETGGVTLPDGTLLDTSGSQTHGLQEAFDLSAEQGWDIFVLPGTYTLNAHVDVEELQLRTFRFEDVTLNFSSSVTDFGLRFDSTMLTNLYWKGGTINASHATHGLLFQPRTPHPLDGQLYGTIGVVDSYFHFNVNIVAQSHRVTMNTQQATINDLTFYFKGLLRNEINFVGSGFAPYNIFEPERTDDPIPFDLFSTAGRITVVPPSSDITAGLPAAVYLPDGSRLNVFGTQTFGLQEAFDYAAAHDLDVVVFGRGIRNVAPRTNLGLYNLSAPLVISDLTDRTYRIYGVTFNYPIAGDTLQLGDVVNSSFEFTGQVVAPNADNALIVRPDNGGVSNSSIRVQAVIGSNGSGDSAVRLDPSLASFQNTTLYFHEVNTGYYGIKVMNPAPDTDFSSNLIRSLHTHATGHIGLQLGEEGANSNRIFGNQVELRTNTDGVTAFAALQVWGDSNTLNIYSGNAGLAYGARYETGSNDNITSLGYVQASTPILNLGVNNSFLAAGMAAGSGSLEDLTNVSVIGAAAAKSEVEASPYRATLLGGRSQLRKVETSMMLIVSNYTNLHPTASVDANLRPMRLKATAIDAAFALDECLATKLLSRISAHLVDPISRWRQVG